MDNAAPTERHLAAERAAAAWLARRDGAGWSPADEHALACWLDADIAHRVGYLRLQAAWAESGRLQALGAGWQADHAPQIHAVRPPDRVNIAAARRNGVFFQRVKKHHVARAKRRRHALVRDLHAVQPQAEHQR